MNPAAEPVASIIVPILNEAVVLPKLLEHLRQLARCSPSEVLMVDGGSTDGSLNLVENAGFQVLTSEPGRARQMNVGAAAARGALLLFLHADTRLPTLNLSDLARQLEASGRLWGRFDVTIEGRSCWLPLVAIMMNWRSRLTGIATGDQAMFMWRRVFEQVGGFPNQALMEDIEISRRLKAQSRPLCLNQRVRTSGRRWDEKGTWSTIWLMWRLRWAYWRGAHPERILERYR